MHTTRVDLLHSPACLMGALFQSIDVLNLANQLWRLHNPRKRGLPFSWQVIDGRGARAPQTCRNSSARRTQ